MQTFVVTAVLAASLCLVSAVGAVPDRAIGAMPEERVVVGVFINYEGAEYETTFLDCDGGVWYAVSNGIRDQLTALHKSSVLSKYGELLVEVRGVFRVDDDPLSHYSGTVELLEIVDHVDGLAEIDDCTKQAMEESRAKKGLDSLDSTP